MAKMAYNCIIYFTKVNQFSLKFYHNSYMSMLVLVFPLEIAFAKKQYPMPRHLFSLNHANLKNLLIKDSCSVGFLKRCLAIIYFYSQFILKH